MLIDHNCKNLEHYILQIIYSWIKVFLLLTERTPVEATVLAAVIMTEPGLDTAEIRIMSRNKWHEILNVFCLNKFLTQILIFPSITCNLGGIWNSRLIKRGEAKTGTLRICNLKNYEDCSTNKDNDFATDVHARFCRQNLAANYYSRSFLLLST